MKDRLIITISDVHGTRAFNIHQIAKKLILFLVLIVASVIAGGFWFISKTGEQMDNYKAEKQREIELKQKEIDLKEREINTLFEKEKKLQAQNQLYSMQIKGKVQDIEALSSKLDHIEEMIGLKVDDEKKEEISNETLASINDRIKNYMFTTIPNGAPLSKTKITSGYGYRIHPITKKKKFHRGIDFQAKRKTPVYATADGIVSFVQSRNIGDFGRVVKIIHNYGFQTIYAHLNRTDVKVGDIIRKGDQIALSGNSGRSTAPHLHYEIKYAFKQLDPNEFIKWKESNYDSILKEERRVRWESLVRLINEQFKMVQQ